MLFSLWIAGKALLKSCEAVSAVHNVVAGPQEGGGTASTGGRVSKQNDGYHLGEMWGALGRCLESENGRRNGQRMMHMDAFGCLARSNQAEVLLFHQRWILFFSTGSIALQLPTISKKLKEQKFRLVTHGIMNWTSLSSFSHIKLWFLIPWRQYTASVLSLALTGTWFLLRNVEPCAVLMYTYNQTPKRVLSTGQV